MKKLLFLALAILPMTMHAQWTTQIIKGDLLAGTKDDISHVYTDSITGNSFVWWESHNDQYMIYSRDKIFDVQTVNSQFTGIYKGIEVAVGLYSAQGEMLERIPMWLDIDTSSGSYNQAHTRRGSKMSVPVGQSKKVKKILKHLTTTDGYVRILASLYGGTSYDLTIPHC